MKRTIAVFAVIAMLMSFIGIPVSAATTSVPLQRLAGQSSSPCLPVWNRSSRQRRLLWMKR